MKAYHVNEGDILAILAGAIGGAYAGPVTTKVQRADDSAIVQIRGPLTHHDEGWFDSYDAIRARFDDAMAKAGRVILAIDSPGGYVSGCVELAHYMRARSVARGKPIVAYVDGQANSAAYMLACSGDLIVIPPAGIVGSIGVVQVVSDASEMAARAGIRYHVLTSGARKADGHPMRSPTDDAIRAMQSTVDELAAVCFDWVAERRGMTSAQVAALDAGVMVGAAAVSRGLANELNTLDDLVAHRPGKRAENMTTKIELTPSQKKAAHTAGMTEAEFIAELTAIQATETPAPKRERTAHPSTVMVDGNPVQLTASQVRAAQSAGVALDDFARELVRLQSE